MLINCIAYQDGRKLADIPIKDVSVYVVRPDCFVWVALKDPTNVELAEMQEKFHLHELAVEDARLGHQRPKIEEYGESILAVMHLVEFVGAEINIGEINVFVGRNYVLSVHNRSQQDFVDVRSRCESEPHFLKQGSGFVLYALMDAVLDSYVRIIEGITDITDDPDEETDGDIDQIHTQLFREWRAREDLQALDKLKQKVLTKKQAVSPLMEATGKFPNHAAHMAELEASLERIYKDLNSEASPWRSTQLKSKLKQKVLTMLQAVFPLMEASGMLYGRQVPAAYVTNHLEYFGNAYVRLVQMNAELDKSLDEFRTFFTDAAKDALFQEVRDGGSARSRAHQAREADECMQARIEADLLTGLGVLDEPSRSRLVNHVAVLVKLAVDLIGDVRAI